MAIVINGSGTVTGLSVGGLPDNVIDNGTMADDAIGLAEMASGTDGNIISYDASGNPVAIATGSDGQVLTSTGAGSPPAFEDAVSGGDVTGGHFTRNIATAGTLALTGFGFTPKAIHFSYGNAYSGLNVGFGYQWGIGTHNCIVTSPWTATGNWTIEPSNGYPITFFSGSGSSGNRTDGRVTSFDSDGVTITFSTPTGSPSGNMRVIYMAWG